MLYVDYVFIIIHKVVIDYTRTFMVAEEWKLSSFNDWIEIFNVLIKANILKVSSSLTA